MTNPLIKTLQEGDELFDKEFSIPEKAILRNSGREMCIMCGFPASEDVMMKKLKSFNHSRSLKLLENIQHEFISLTTKNFVILLDEAINLYRK